MLSASITSGIEARVSRERRAMQIEANETRGSIR